MSVDPTADGQGVQCRLDAAQTTLNRCDHIVTIWSAGLCRNAALRVHGRRPDDLHAVLHSLVADASDQPAALRVRVSRGELRTPEHPARGPHGRAELRHDSTNRSRCNSRIRRRQGHALVNVDKIFVSNGIASLGADTPLVFAQDRALFMSMGGASADRRPLAQDPAGDSFGGAQGPSRA